MPSIAQNVADNLFEIGKSAVKGTADAVKAIAGESIEQITSTPSTATSQNAPKNENGAPAIDEKKKIEEHQQYERVKAELETYRQRKEALDRKIAEEKAMENQQVKQKKAQEKQEHESWVSKVINRAQTGTEKGRSTE